MLEPGRHIQPIKDVEIGVAFVDTLVIEAVGTNIVLIL